MDALQAAGYNTQTCVKCGHVNILYDPEILPNCIVVVGPNGAPCGCHCEFPQVEGAETSTEAQVTARELAQDMIIEVSKSCGYPDSTWLNPLFRYQITERIVAALESHQRLITEMTEEEDRCRDLLATYDKSSPDGVVPLSEVAQSAISAQVNEALERAAGVAEKEKESMLAGEESATHGEVKFNFSLSRQTAEKIAAEIRALKKE